MQELEIVAEQIVEIRYEPVHPTGDGAWADAGEGVLTFYLETVPNSVVTALEERFAWENVDPTLPEGLIVSLGTIATEARYGNSTYLGHVAPMAPVAIINNVSVVNPTRCGQGARSHGGSAGGDGWR